jgi:hypothetical protein
MAEFCRPRPHSLLTGVISDATKQQPREIWCDAPKVLDLFVKVSKNDLCCGAP